MTHEKLFLAALILACHGTAVAQAGSDSLNRRGPVVVLGVVTGADGAGLKDVEMQLDGRRTRTDVAGTFRFEGASLGEHTLVARHIGYRAESRSIVVNSERFVVNIALRVVSLAPVVTRAAAIGLSGIVIDTALQRLRGANLDVVGTNAHGKTDSLGAFFLKLNPGQYLVSVSLEKHRTQLVSVNIQRDSGRHMIVTMPEALEQSDAREKAAVFDLRGRLLRRNPQWSRVFTREEIEETGYANLNQVAAIVTGGQGISGGPCYVYIDGGPQKDLIWKMGTANVEFFEVYLQHVNTGVKPKGSGGKNRATESDLNLQHSSCGLLNMVAWLRD